MPYASGSRTTALPPGLTDAQWALIEAVLPPARQGRTGRPRTYRLHEVWNPVFYLTRTDCSWRALPYDFPPWALVWEHFRRWHDAGTPERVHAALRAQARVQAGRAPLPTAAAVDSQSVRSTERGAGRLRCRQEGQRREALPRRRPARADPRRVRLQCRRP